ncbi:hypothetical protein [Paenibacillus polymyxa]|uniref:hypothetical protein n=1 Tax=Paenibacillus polymyxa TaxID=1406 RepID=UPI00201E0ADE|nr:hypothetical protein [Paenibacillus polymyxa]
MDWIEVISDKGLIRDIKEEIKAERINGEITEKEAIKLKEIIVEKKNRIRKEFSH